MDLTILDTEVLTDNVYMDLVIDPTESFPFRTHVMKKKEEPNVYERVLNLPGNQFALVRNERDKRRK